MAFQRPFSTFGLCVLCVVACSSPDVQVEYEFESARMETESRGVIGTHVLGKGIQVAEGDILVARDELRPSDDSEFDLSRARRDAADLRDVLWPNQAVPYVFAADYGSRHRVLEAMDVWETLTGIRFVEHSNQVDFIVIRGSDDDISCASWVGRQGGPQDFFANPRCPTGSIIHELGHVLGLEHEHTRSDRDRFITVQWQNVESGGAGNFRKRSTSELGGYNTRSVMHYGSLAFSATGEPTTIRKDGSLIQFNRTLPANSDISRIRRDYGLVVQHLSAPVVSIDVDRTTHDVRLSWTQDLPNRLVHHVFRRDGTRILRLGATARGGLVDENVPPGDYLYSVQPSQSGALAQSTRVSVSVGR